MHNYQAHKEPRGLVTLIILYIQYIGLAHFWGSKFRISILRLLGRCSEKNNIFGGYEDFMVILEGHHKNWTRFRDYFYIF